MLHRHRPRGRPPEEVHRRSLRPAARAARPARQAGPTGIFGVVADESPLAYKDIERVMALQEAAGLLQQAVRMQPIAVLMAGEPGDD